MLNINCLDVVLQGPYAVFEVSTIVESTFFSETTLLISPDMVFSTYAENAPFSESTGDTSSQRPRKATRRRSRNQGQNAQGRITRKRFCRRHRGERRCLWSTSRAGLRSESE